jgi:hypothetical protein
MSFKVRNWPAYEAGLRRRGSLTLWIEDAALECWQTSGPSGQARYTGAAIQTSLMLRAAFKLPLRQIEGLMTISASTAASFSCRTAWSLYVRRRMGLLARLYIGGDIMRAYRRQRQAALVAPGEEIDARPGISTARRGSFLVILG